MRRGALVAMRSQPWRGCGRIATFDRHFPLVEFRERRDWLVVNSRDLAPAPYTENGIEVQLCGKSA